jgi:hypothetical protein
MYLVFAIVAETIGAALSVAMRMELMYPGLQIFPSVIVARCPSAEPTNRGARYACPDVGPGHREPQ